MTMTVDAKTMSQAFTQLEQGAEPAQAQAQQFEALMQQNQLLPPGYAEPDKGSMVSHLIEKQDQAERRLFGQMENMLQTSDQLSPLEAIHHAGEFMMVAGLTQFDMQAKLSVVQSSKSSLDSLMKNQ